MAAKAAKYSRIRGTVILETSEGQIAIEFQGSQVEQLSSYQEIGAYAGTQIAKQLKAIGDPSGPELQRKVESLQEEVAELKGKLEKATSKPKPKGRLTAKPAVTA